MIITIYKPDGTKERRPTGYGGGLCNTATQPYERREVPGSVRKTATSEALEEPAAEVAVTEKVKAKR